MKKLIVYLLIVYMGFVILGIFIVLWLVCEVGNVDVVCLGL